MGLTIQEMVAQKKKEQAAKKAANLRTMKPAPGKHTYRILPTWRLKTMPEACKEGAQPFWHDFAQHWVRAEKGGKPVAYVCMDKTFGAECPICSAIGRGISASSDDATVELLKDANAAQKYLFNVLHRSGDKPNEVQVMEVGTKIYDQILEFVAEYGDITDLKEGKDLIITREGTGMDTKYTVLPAGKHQPVDASVLDSLYDLDAVVQQENETKLHLALDNVAKACGVLPAPRSAGGNASLVDMSDVDDAEYSDVGEVVDESVAADDISDDELDDLLGDLETGS